LVSWFGFLVDGKKAVRRTMSVNRTGVWNTPASLATGRFCARQIGERKKGQAALSPEMIARGIDFQAIELAWEPLEDG
jgi:hypothetical protein